MRLIGVIAIAVGCSSTGGVGAEDDVIGPGDDGHDILLEPTQGKETQGKDLLGERLDGLGLEPGYHANVRTDAVTADGTPVTVTFDGSASLRSGTHRGVDRFFDGMLLTGSEGAKLRLSVVRGGHDVALYRIEGQTAPDTWMDLCAIDGVPGEAIPLAGKWQRSGFHEHAADRISFACAGSVAFKCSIWGFLAGSDDTSLGWRAHQACTRMARADYCADGRSHTREGTRIRMYDFAGVTSRPPRRFEGVQAWAPDPDRLFFEAAWSDGAHPATCLSRLRWQSLPPGPLCAPRRPGEPPDLPDPRRDMSVRFCEDLEWPADGEMPTGALLFNESAYADLEMYIWNNGNDLVSTVRGLDFAPVHQPFPRFGTFAQMTRDAMLIRARPVGAEDVELLEVHAYGKLGDVVVAASAPPGFEDLGREGYVRKVATRKTVPLKLYVHAETGDWLSTANPPPAGYVLQSTIGHVLPAETR